VLRVMAGSRCGVKYVRNELDIVFRNELWNWCSAHPNHQQILVLGSCRYRDMLNRRKTERILVHAYDWKYLFKGFTLTRRVVSRSSLLNPIAELLRSAPCSN
jgi:hypothetical protein